MSIQDKVTLAFFGGAAFVALCWIVTALASGTRYTDERGG
jgi:hypothetical protein